MRAPFLLLLSIVTLAGPIAAGLGPAPAPQAAAAHHVHMLVVGGAVFQFDPPVLQVAAGDSVVFHSHDILHSATSGLLLETEPAEGLAPPNARLNAFDTGATPGGQTRTVTIGEAGAYPYYCTVGFHRLFGMHGIVLAQ